MKQLATDNGTEERSPQRKRGRGATGPKTREGKKRSSLNAVTHGITAKDLVLATESKEEFNSWMREYLHHYNPHGPVETALVQTLVITRWRWRRLLRAENGAIMAHQKKLTQRFQAAQAWKTMQDDSLPASERRLAKTRWEEDQNIARLLGTLPELDQCERFAKYESRVNRDFFCAVERLEQLQLARLRDSSDHSVLSFHVGRPAQSKG
jgi:hypothetical protein